jgi:phage virion morphogenesis protein
MTNRLEALENWASGLLGQLEPTARNRLVRSLGHALRKSQQQRIIAQRNPGGSKYAPRKHRNLRGKLGRMKRKMKMKMKMFQKLRTAGFLKVQGDGNAITIGYTGRIAQIARVHQFGLKDRPERGAPDIQYDQREVLGFTEADLDLIREGLLAHLTVKQL